MAMQRGPRFTRLEADARRQAILTAARELFAQRAYEAVSMADVAAQAGVTRPLVNHYFGGKRELFLDVLRDLAQEAPRAIRTDLDLPIEEIVARNVDSWLDHFEHGLGGLSALFWVDHRDPELDAIADEARERLIDRILSNQTGSPDAPPQIRLLLRAYTGMALAACREWLVMGRADRAQVHALLTHGLLALMRDAAPRLTQS